MEVVNSLTSQSFLYALKRFIGRRGICSHLWCDNATNFVGCRRELEDLRLLLTSNQHIEGVQRLCAESNIQFHHIPKRSPHFGGLWEAAVKSAKRLIYRQLSEASITMEELTTIIIQVEAILNSRPITPMSADPGDLEALTPGHFLVGEPLVTIPEPNAEQQTKFNKNISILRYNIVREKQQHFWSRWSKEYLSELQNRSKWKTSSININPGTLVLMVDENSPPQRWSMGRVVSTHPGTDGKVRAVTLWTGTCETTRAINRIAPLPIESSEIEST
jgi:hypothetical protein